MTAKLASRWLKKSKNQGNKNQKEKETAFAKAPSVEE
jgi:hypothetical protein